MIDLKTASARTGLKRKTLWRACWELRLPARKVRVGRSYKWVVAPAALETFLSTFRPHEKVRHEYARRVLAGESVDSIAHDQSLKPQSVRKALNREGIKFNNKREMVTAAS